MSRFTLTKRFFHRKMVDNVNLWQYGLLHLDWHPNPMSTCQGVVPSRPEMLISRVVEP